MNWNSVPEFLAMGGYGLYVWGAFGASALLLVAEVISLRVRRRALRTWPAEALAPVAAHVVDYHGAPAGHTRDHGVLHEA